MSKTPDKKDVKNIIVSMADGSTWEAVWDEYGLKLVKEVTPPKGGSGDPFQELLEEFEEEQESRDNEAAEDEQEGGQPEEGEESEEEPQEEQPAQGAGESPPPPQEMPPSELEPISDNAFKARLQSIMRDNMYDRRTPNKSRGKLDMKKLFRVKTGATNVFTQKEAKKNKKYSVVLCVDTSSSMADDGKKHLVAADSTALLVKTLQLAGIDVAVVGFGPVVVLKDFNTHADKKMIGRIHGAIKNAPGGTPMYEGMLAGYSLLGGREGHKLMVVMADGASAMRLQSSELHINKMNKAGKIVADGTIKTGWGDREDREYKTGSDLYYSHNMSSRIFYDEFLLKPFKELVKSHKDVDTVGIGIMDAGMPDYILDSKIIKNIEELKPVIVHEIKKRVRRG